MKINIGGLMDLNAPNLTGFSQRVYPNGGQDVIIPFSRL